MYISHKNLKDNSIKADTFHDYVVSNFSTSGLIVAPTGSGKTIIAIRIIANLVDKYKIWIVAPTNVLINQHYNALKLFLTEDILVYKITSNEKERYDNLAEAQIIITTPHLFYHMSLDSRFINPDILIVDEAHHIVEGYPYDAIINFRGYKIGFTASPGYQKTRIKQILKYLDTTHLYYKEGVYNIENIIRELKLGPRVEKLYVEFYEEFYHLYKNILNVIPKLKFIPLENAFTSNIVIPIPLLGPLALAIRYKHVLNLLGGQDISLVKNYIRKNYLKLTGSANVIPILKDILTTEEINYKLEELLKIIEAERLDQNKGIVFVKYKEMLEIILNKLNGAVKLVGKSGKNGKYLQQFAIEQIKQNGASVIVATSIGEEGLDIPDLDYVIFYDIPASEKRLIQRRGRTGRTKAGRVYYLINMGTLEEDNYIKSVSRELKMYKNMKEYEHN